MSAHKFIIKPLSSSQCRTNQYSKEEAELQVFLQMTVSNHYNISTVAVMEQS